MFLCCHGKTKHCPESALRPCVAQVQQLAAVAAVLSLAMLILTKPNQAPKKLNGPPPVPTETVREPWLAAVIAEAEAAAIGDPLLAQTPLKLPAKMIRTPNSSRSGSGGPPPLPAALLAVVRLAPLPHFLLNCTPAHLRPAVHTLSPNLVHV